MKGRTGQSPDLADAAALVVHMGRTLGAGHLKKTTRRDKEWEKLSLKYDSLYNEDNMYAQVEE